MENRMVKFYSKESNLLAMHAIPGHFATSHSHINYYVDVTSLKTRAGEAREAAKVLYSRMHRAEYVDTIVCMDGTEVVGAFLSQEIENGGVLSTNRHETIYVVTPEFNSNNQMLFRDNNKGQSPENTWYFSLLRQQPARRSAEVLSVSVTMEAR